MSVQVNGEQLEEAFVSYAADHPRQALELVTGLFVGLVMAAVEHEGHDPDKKIDIDGCGNRNITIHPKEGVE